MVSPAPRIGQTTIRHATPIRATNAPALASTPRLSAPTITPIRPGTIVQTVQSQQPMPALQPVGTPTLISGTTQVWNFVSNFFVSLKDFFADALS